MSSKERKGDYMLTVKITYLDGTTDIKDCTSVDDICLDNVESVIIVRDERIKRVA